VWQENLNISDVLVSLRENMHLETVSNESADLPSSVYRDVSDEEGDDE